MKKNSDNKVHVHGWMNNVTELNAMDNKKSFFIELATVENYKDNAGDYQAKKTYHKINVVTDDKAAIEKLEGIAADLQMNYENREAEGYKTKTHEASFDGILITRKNTVDNVDYYNSLIVSSVEDMKLDCKQEKDEVRNAAEIKGNIAKIDIHDDFAVIRVATHYFAPGEGVNYKGETKPYHDETSYVDTRLSGSFRKKEFEAIKNGAIEVGDLVNVRGQIHNTKYTDKDGVNRYNVVVDLNKVELIAKAKKNQSETEEKKVEEAPKEAPKAKKATSRKKQVSM